MCPVPVLFLLLAALTSESTASLSGDNTGQRFIVAFPENIAYYHPVQPKNMVRIIALYNATKVTITAYSYPNITEMIYSRQSKDIIVNWSLELRNEELSNKTLVITSTKAITVTAISLRDNSVQTAVVIPTDKLGKEYLIPPIPKIKGKTDQLSVTERKPFRLVIISADQETSVTVHGSKRQVFKLLPRQIKQIWVKEQDGLRSVSASQPVAVLFALSCAMRHNCICGLLYNMLPPAKQQLPKFFIPPALADDAYDETFLLLSKKGSYKKETFNPDSPLVATASSAILYRPGLLLTLIPDTDFASCFAVSHISGTKSSAVIMVHKDFTQGVHHGNGPLNADWQELKGTEYVSTTVVLKQVMNIIWHTSTKMAVYVVGNNGSAPFGNPAPIISTNPDFRGCTLVPQVVKLGESALGWRESLQYCREQNLQLVSISSAEFEGQIYREIIQANVNGVKEVWIGMRRSIQNGAWYWLNSQPVHYTNWKQGEPSALQDGQCAIMSLQHGMHFGWSDRDCCKAARPVCYREPVLFPPPE